MVFGHLVISQFRLYKQLIEFLIIIKFNLMSNSNMSSESPMADSKARDRRSNSYPRRSKDLLLVSNPLSTVAFRALLHNRR